MPWVQTKDKSFYKEPFSFAYDSLSVDFLVRLKNNHVKDRELFLLYQKKYGRNDPLVGKQMREAASEEMKRYRGCCFALSIISCSPAGDSIALEASKELSPYIDDAFRNVDLDWCFRHDL